MFWKEYIELEILRHGFSKVLMMIFFIIFVLNIKSYIRKSLYLLIPTCFYKKSLDHNNITQIINSNTKPKFEDLNFLISKARLIFKTIVFVNKINNEIALAACFWNLLLPE